MRLLPVILACIALAAGRRHIPNAKYRKHLEKIFGKPLDVSIVNRIVAREAKKLGIPAQEHFHHCFLDKHAKLDLIREGYKQLVRFSTVDKIFLVLAALSKRAKDFEKNTCFRTMLRIGEVTGMNKGKITRIISKM